MQTEQTQTSDPVQRAARRRRLRWLALGLVLLVAGSSWTVWVTYGAPADATGATAVVRWLKPILYGTVVGAVFCFSRAAAGRSGRPPVRDR